MSSLLPVWKYPSRDYLLWYVWRGRSPVWGENKTNHQKIFNFFLDTFWQWNYFQNSFWMHLINSTRILALDNIAVSLDIAFIIISFSVSIRSTCSSCKSGNFTDLPKTSWMIRCLLEQDPIAQKHVAKLKRYRGQVTIFNFFCICH